MKISFFDLTRQYQQIRGEIEPAVRGVLDSQQFVLGPHVESCEKAISGYCATSFAIGVSSGTDALLMCLMAEGVGPGDEVITTPYTFIASANVISRLGAVPVFVDIREDTFNIDPICLEEHITERTRAIVPIHMFGQCADMDPILEIANHHSLVVIEDAAQAIGAVYCGRQAGSMGHYGCLSFFPTKNLGGFGDGGMVLTNDPDRAQHLRQLRNHGMEPKYFHHRIGGNFRLDALQAAVVNIKLPHLDAWSQERRQNAERYRLLFEDAGITPGMVQLPRKSAPGCSHIYNQFVVRVENRDDVRAFLSAQGVGTEIYYPIPLHRQPCFEGLDYGEGDFPVSEQAAKETIALPIFPELTDVEAEHVAHAFKTFFQS